MKHMKWESIKELPLWKWFYPCIEVETEWEEAFPWP
jgi:hypothetical protein